VLLCSCVPWTHAGPQGMPVAPKGIVLQGQDLPALQKCPQSDKWAGLMLSGQPEMLPTGMASWSMLQSAGATDGSYLRSAGIPTYGHSGLASDVDDVRVHGKDERVLVKSFFDGQEYLYRLVRTLSGGK